MNLKTFWEWLTTSRAYRLLLQQNSDLKSEITALRQENKRLLLAVSPTLRALEPATAEPSAGAVTDVPKKENPVPRTMPPRRVASWRASRQQLEFNEATTQRRIERLFQPPSA